jgi:hypothetical protein
MLVGFDVSIVYIYRDWLSHFVSYVGQMNKHADAKAHPFSAYTLDIMDDVPPILNVSHTLQTYSTVFGIANISVIDMAGTLAAGVPIEKVLLCEVGKILCASQGLFGLQVYDNAKVDPIVPVLFSIFRAHVESKFNLKCRFCHGLEDGYSFISNIYNASLVTRTSTGKVVTQLPTINSRLTLLLPHARRMDAAVRLHYGHRMLHGNQTANVDVMTSHVHIEELCVERFASDPQWAMWLETQYKAALAANMLCGCERKTFLSSIGLLK